MHADGRNGAAARANEAACERPVDLAVAVRTDGPTTRVRLDGELDVTSAPLLQTVVDQALAARGGRRAPGWSWT